MARRLRTANSVQLLLICVATLCVFGPHLIILGYKAAGVSTPAALTFLCPLHRAGGSTTSSLSASWTTGARAGWTSQPSNNRPALVP